GADRVRDHGRLVPAAHGADARRHDAGRDRARAAARRAPAGRGRADRAAARPPPGRRSIQVEAVVHPVVLFDLDGTVVDSGPIIPASMRYAAQTVLGLDYTDAELLAQVGGPGLEAQMAAIAPGRTDELVRVYREHNEPLHDTLAGFDGIET